LKSWIWWWE